MSTPAKTIREVLGRVKSGMAGAREAKQLQEYVEHLTWRAVKMNDGQIYEFCRHCSAKRHGLPVGDFFLGDQFTRDRHADDCPAQEVA